MKRWKIKALRPYMEQAAGDDGAGGSTGGGATGGSTGEGATGGDQSGQQQADDKGAKKPSDEEARLIKEVMAKKEQLRQTSQELTNAKTLLAQIEELGGVETLKQLADKHRENEQKSLEAKGDWERLRQRMADEHTRATEALKQQVESLTQQVQQRDGTLVELTIGSQFSQSGFIKEDLLLTPTKARQIYGTHFDFVDGKVVGFDKPRGQENRTQLVDSMGDPVNFDTALRQIVEMDPEKDHLIRSKAKPGAGSDSKKTSAAAQTNTQRQLSGVELIASALSKATARK